MFKQTMYSKYQKRVIRFLTDLLGTETPFTYEKTQANHLKVLIDGVPKPMYTGSTPSDRKSFDNFIADVKRELKASKIDYSLGNASQPELEPSETIDESYDKLIQSCVKTLRTRLGMIKSKEQEKLLESRSIDVIADYRNEVIKNTVALATQARKPNGYIKHQEMKLIESKVLKHLKFMMPSLAHYSELLDSKSKYKKELTETVAEEKTLVKTVTSSDSLVQNKALETPLKIAPEQQPETVKLNNKSLTNTNSSVFELMSKPINNRIKALRYLTKAQALQLVDDVNQAMALNREEDIAAIVALIKEKDVPLEAIIAQLGES